MVEGAADKAATQQVRVLPCQLPVSDMKQGHIPEQVTVRAMRGVNGLAARCTQRHRGGSSLEV
jgi:hypothetical protein